ncbi:MAG: hypothetical protein R3C44_14230 [Chloroflexota bacterium]
MPSAAPDFCVGYYSDSLLGLLLSLVGWVGDYCHVYRCVRLEVDNGKAIPTVIASLIVIFVVQHWLVDPLLSGIF